jgi:hypothetical protein
VTLASFVLQAVLLYLVVRMSYPVPYEWARLLKLSLACALPLALSFISPFTSTGVKIILFLSVLPLLIIFRFFDERERVHLRAFLRWA